MWRIKIFSRRTIRKEPVDIQAIVADLKAERNRINQAISGPYGPSGVKAARMPWVPCR